MAVAISTLKVDLSLDAGNYKTGAAAKVAADGAMVVAGDRVIANQVAGARQMEIYQRSQRGMMDVQLAAIRANNDLARSYGAANDNYQGFARGLVAGASSTLETISHLKLLAVAAFAISPAIRSMAAAGVGGTLSLLGANAGLAAAAMSRVAAVAGPALSFFTRLSIPVGIAVASFKLLADTVERGSDLLAKYGGTAGQRAMFGTGVDESLSKLTRFQDETVSAQQIQYATQLGSRLEEAKKTLHDIFKVSFDLTDPALRLQNAWVVIVETLAKAATLAGQIPSLFGDAARAVGQSSIWDKLPKVSAAQEAAIIARIEANNGKVAELAQTAEEAFELAKKRLAAGMGGGFVGRFNQSIMDLANPPKLDKPEEVKSVADAWTRYADQVTKATAAREADLRTVGLGVAAHEQLRVQLQGEAVLARAGVKDTDARRAALAELARQAGETAQALALARAQNAANFTSKTQFFAPEDLAVAQAMNQIWRTEWPKHTQDNLALQIKFNSQIVQARDLLAPAASQFVKDLVAGESVMAAMPDSAKSLAGALLSKPKDDEKQSEPEKKAA